MMAEERIGDLEDQLLGARPNEALKELVTYRTRLGNVLGIIPAVAVAMVVLFRKIRWL